MKASHDTNSSCRGLTRMIRGLSSRMAREGRFNSRSSSNSRLESTGRLVGYFYPDLSGTTPSAGSLVPRTWRPAVDTDLDGSAIQTGEIRSVHKQACRKRRRDSRHACRKTNYRRTTRRAFLPKRPRLPSPGRLTETRKFSTR
jgi:hypothetical protein